MTEQGRFLYSLSLPERAVRSTVGLTAGAALEVAKRIVPQAFQSSKSYTVLIDNSLRFLTQNVGGAAAAGAEPAVGQDYIARKAVGNFIDLAGLATLHLSPLWALAVVSDLAYGSKTYIVALAQELERQGLIDQGSTIHEVDDVLEALQKSMGSAATLFDTPPLSLEELQRSLAEARQAAQSADLARLLPQAELTRYWNEMAQIASREGVGLLEVSSAMTMHALGKLGLAGRGMLTSVNVAGGLFQQHVLGHYANALETIRRDGFYQTLRVSSQPYVEAVWNNFAPQRRTWTEQLLSGQFLGSALATMRTWWRARPAAPEPPAPPRP